MPHSKGTKHRFFQLILSIKTAITLKVLGFFSFSLKVKRLPKIQVHATYFALFPQISVIRFLKWSNLCTMWRALSLLSEIVMDPRFHGGSSTRCTERERERERERVYSKRSRIRLCKKKLSSSNLCTITKAFYSSSLLKIVRDPRFDDRFAAWCIEDRRRE